MLGNLTRMKPISVIATFRQCLLAVSLIFALLPTLKISAQPVLSPLGNKSQSTLTEPQPQAADAAGCQWTYYPVSGGKLQPEQPLFNDPDNTPIVNLSLGNLFKGKAAHLAGTGSTDLDGDNKTDVFRTVPRNDGNLEWQYSSGGAKPWQNLGYASATLPATALQFGDINGDLKTDVFANYYNPGLKAHQWLVLLQRNGQLHHLEDDDRLCESPDARRFQR